MEPVTDGRIPRENSEKRLTDKERRLARLLVLEPDIPMARAAWLAGYCGGDPDLPEPKDTKSRDKLAKSATHARERPHVQAEIARLQRLQATNLQARAAMGEREAQVELEARERRLDNLTAEADVIDLGARLLALKLDAAMFDVGEIITWEPYDNGFVKVRGSAEMPAAHRRLVQKIQFHPRCGACGQDHEKPGLTLEFVPKATFSAQASKQLGLDAPRKLEVTGKDGAPLIGGQDRGIRGETVEAIRRLIVGAPVELPAIKGGG